MDFCEKAKRACPNLTIANEANRLAVSGDQGFHYRARTLIEGSQRYCTSIDCGITAFAGALALLDHAANGEPYSLQLAETTIRETEE